MWENVRGEMREKKWLINWLINNKRKEKRGVLKVILSCILKICLVNKLHSNHDLKTVLSFEK